MTKDQIKENRNFNHIVKIRNQFYNKPVEQGTISTTKPKKNIKEALSFMNAKYDKMVEKNRDNIIRYN